MSREQSDVDSLIFFPISDHSLWPPLFRFDRASSKAAGYSLIEVLVALAVVTIVAGMAAVSLGPYWQKHQLRQMSGRLLEQIQVCRMKAIVERKTCQLTADGQVLLRRCRLGIDWSEWEKYRFSGPAEMTMSGSGYFTAKGFATPKSIVVQHDGYRQKIVININGRARISGIY